MSSTQTPKLNVILGVSDEATPNLGRSNSYVSALMRRLAEDPDPNFLSTAKGLTRTSQSMPAVALISHYMLHGALEDGALGLDELYLIFLLILFVLIIDDFMDTCLDPREHTTEYVRAYADRLLRCCAEGELDDADAIIRYIARLTARLRAYPAFGHYAEVYHQALTAMLDGMVEEFGNRDPSSTDLEQYMRYAAHSVGTNIGLIASLILLGDTSLADRKERLWIALDIVASIIRFSNDIRSYEREIEEGKFSSLILAAQKFGIDLNQIHESINHQDILRIIRALMIADVYDLKDCVAYLHSGGHFEAVIVNAVLGVVCLYEEADFHTLVMASADA